MNQSSTFDVFSQNGYVPTFGTHGEYVASLIYYFGLVQEVAGLHARSKKAAIPDLMKEGLSWVILYTNMEVCRYLRWPEKWECRTFIKKCRNPNLSQRRVVCFDENGEMVFRADTVWAVVRMADHSIFPGGELFDRFGYRDDLCGDFDSSHVRKFTIDSPDIVCRRKALWTDSDINSHVNNISYVRWVMESIDGFDEQSIRSVHVYFSKETMVGDEIEIRIKKEGEVIRAMVNDSAYLELKCQN